MTTVAKLICCLQSHDPDAIVVTSHDYGIMRPLYIESISDVTLHELDYGYAVSEDDEGTPGVVLA